MIGSTSPVITVRMWNFIRRLDTPCDHCIPIRVEEGFPRIVSGDLPGGVSDVRYLVSTSSCGAFQITERSALEEYS